MAGTRHYPMELIKRRQKKNTCKQEKKKKRGVRTTPVDSVEEREGAVVSLVRRVGFVERSSSLPFGEERGA